MTTYGLASTGREQASCDNAIRHDTDQRKVAPK
jgi:hypothetical protein